MPRQSPSHPSPQTEAHRAELVDAQSDSGNSAGHRERLPSTVRRRAPYARRVPLSEPPLDGCRHGHVVGHRIGGPPPLSFDGRPHGHVVGHRIGEPPPPSFDGRPHGHVVGHGVGVAAPLPLRVRYRKAA